MFSKNLKKYLDGLEKLKELHNADKMAEADEFFENELNKLWQELNEEDIYILNKMGNT